MILKERQNVLLKKRFKSTINKQSPIHFISNPVCMCKYLFTKKILQIKIY